MSVTFLLREGEASPDRQRALPEGTTVQVWRAGEKASFPIDPLHLAVTMQHKLGLFHDDRYTEFSIWCAGTRVHRLVVTPRWHRFPFMAPGDLQIGALWTHPAWRRLGLASLAIYRAHGLFAEPGQRFWYVTESSNAASLALARASGYRLVGEGRRTKPIGIAMLGQFQLERDYAHA